MSNVAAPLERIEERPSIDRQAGGRLISYSHPWPETSLLAFLEQAADRPRVFWENGEGSLGFAGFGVTATLQATGPDRFRSIEAQAWKLFDDASLHAGAAPPQVYPRLFGGFAFRPHSDAAGVWTAFPAAYFVLPRYLLTRWDGRNWLTINHRLADGEDPAEVRGRLEQESRQLWASTEEYRGREPEPALPPTLEAEHLMAPEAWRQLVTTATDRIRRGELDKVVLARSCRVRASRPIDPLAVLARLQRNYPNCYRFLIEPRPGHVFYGATPELLAEVAGTGLRTVALAGSIRRGNTPAEDEALGQELLANPKERWEHALVVESLRRRLRPLVTNLEIPSQPDLCRLSNIQHLQTEVQGRLAGRFGVLPVVEALHPTPAMGGSPREVALRFLETEEPVARGWYAAPVGWFGPQGDGHFAVAIRSAVGVGREAYLFAGAGIVADSDPDREWHETQLKFRPMLQALGHAPDSSKDGRRG